MHNNSRRVPISQQSVRRKGSALIAVIQAYLKERIISKNHILKKRALRLQHFQSAGELYCSLEFIKNSSIQIKYIKE